LADAQLAAFLAAWVKLDLTRLIITTRHPFPLPGRAERRLPRHHLGPLSQAETRKLLWRLPALDKLDPTQRKRAYTDVGGHPRSLEYLDALLAGGHARFDDIAERVENALLATPDIDDVDAWLGGVKGDLDRALAETITLAADDVLLDALLDRLESIPHARQLLLAAAVYREPVDDTGLAWQIADHHPPAPDPDRNQRINDTAALLTQARREDLTDAEVGLTDDQLDQWNRDWEQLRRPPLTITPDYPRARDTLLRLGLLSPVTTTTDHDSGPLYIAHRWTATALTPRTNPDDLTEAHRRAAQYWQWRVDVWPQDRTTDIEQLVEARHHHHQSGDLSAAISASYTIRDQLHTWGAWTWQHDLCTETLTWLPDNTRDRAAFTHQLGLIAELRGDYTQAEQRYHAALTILEEIGDRAGIATSYHQLGLLAQLGGDYTQAEQHYHASLTIREEFGDRAGIADSYHQLGNIAYLRGDYTQAEQRYHASLTINEEIGNRAGIATSYHQLGMIAEFRGDYDQAEQRYHAALTINEEIGDRAGIAISYHQLGNIAQARGDYDQAEQRYHASLTINEEIGNREGIATTTSQIGALLTAQGKAAEAVPYNLAALSTQAAIGSAQVQTDLYWLGQQRDQLGDHHFDALLTDHLDDDSKRIVLQALAPTQC
jgi:tetratricopeptide (TPR) repeat protein